MTEQDTQASELIAKLEAALNVPYHESQAARAEQAKIMYMQQKAANAPIADWQPPSPEKHDLKDWVRLILKGDDESRKSRAWHSSIRDFNLTNERGEMIRVMALDHSLPLWLKAEYFRNGDFGRDNRELQKAYDAGLIVVEPASLDGKTHQELRGLAALKIARWTGMAFYAAIEAGRDTPRIESARLIAAMVKVEQPRLAKVLEAYGSGAQALSESDRQVLYPVKTLDSQEGQGGFQPVGALVES